MILLGDVVALARVLAAVAPQRRQWVGTRIRTEAQRARQWRSATGRAHPRYGDGSIMAAALRRPATALVEVDEDAAACLRLALCLLGLRDLTMAAWAV